MTSASNTAKHVSLRGLIGIAIGALFLWLAFRDTTWQKVQHTLTNVHSRWLALAIIAYGTDLSIRIIRWQNLLREFKPLTFKSVGAALLVGYAMNNILPARLGELVRANFTGKRFRLSRTAVIASIAVERVLDGLIVVACLVIGRLFISDHVVLNRLTIAGSALFLGVFGVLWFMSRSCLEQPLVYIPRPIGLRLEKFQQGLSVIRGSKLKRAIMLSFPIWFFEGITFWAVLNSVGVNLTVQQMLSVIGVVSLSTLLPSPPGFVGTYQYAFAFIIGLMGYTSTQGIAAATVAQIFLMGSVTILGIFLYFRCLRRK